MDFYYAPTACSQAAHILLHETGLPFRPHKVDIFQHKLEDGSSYETINPNGYVPALVFDDGMLLTENVALLDWIAMQGDDLVPGGPLGRTRHLQTLAFISTELQKPFVRLFFSESEEEKAWLSETLARRFAWIASRVEGDHLFGAHFTASDAFLYVMLRWAAMCGIEVPAVLRGLARRIEARPAVRAVLEKEAVEPLGVAA
ncbi:glutathione S-transferase C-terminal domain-containing protein [Sinorhizobium sp. RAC02]|uniref:glutathione S-transferase C-terminal domain-containing protein n=1 Tax=Sinorhizobium sp. RAC02 TaxID=1842534 RepID=UPI00083D30AD|nr:glutathione S-transferase C-terminal domain-containing protein [Sinorhizobium sp. RAC02]AOF90854.1 glutathione S-transferase [Sinorhizobium sp. RAC02]